ncbi:rho GTPase-activating SYDE2, putative [Babesia ovata]|uniref:Rho GTPase-activating SYDE2, putative n=1 Tax=Babesia ovata TaxID=189622 RepID=A0A2H6KIT1_9APIC|nr:rho GTPase-activating SYDE2, putative [Babesia ovata]GBE62904.1 rho GTPase-activating SYDE2, putative [Babesia ovata]
MERHRQLCPGDWGLGGRGCPGHKVPREGNHRSPSPGRRWLGRQSSMIATAHIMSTGGRRPMRGRRRRVGEEGSAVDAGVVGKRTAPWHRQAGQVGILGSRMLNAMTAPTVAVSITQSICELAGLAVEVMDWPVMESVNAD